MSTKHPLVSTRCELEIHTNKGAWKSLPNFCHESLLVPLFVWNGKKKARGKEINIKIKKEILRTGSQKSLQFSRKTCFDFFPYNRLVAYNFVHRQR